MGEAVPTEICTRYDERAAMLAVRLLDEGLLPPELRTSDPAAVGAMCQDALQAWVAERAAEFRFLSLTVSFDSLREWNDQLRTPGTVRACCYAHEVAEVVCGPTMQRLFAIDPRLPYAVLSLTERAAWKAVPLLSCSHQKALAEWLLWGGCQSPQEHAEENELEGEDRASYLESTLHPEQLAERTPMWVFDLPDPAHQLTKDDLREIAAATVDPLCSQILVTLAALDAMDAPEQSTHPRMEQDGGMFVGFGALLRYASDDHLPLLADELGNYSMESGEAYDSVIVDVFKLDTDEDFRAMLQGLHDWLQACRLLDHLLFLLGGADSIYGGNGE